MRIHKRSTRFGTSARMAVAAVAAGSLLLTACSPANEADSDQANTATDNAPASSGAASEESQSESGLSFTEAYVTAKPADKPMTGVFGQLKNTTDKDITLETAKASVDGKIEFHIVENGEMKEAENGFTIKAGETMTLQPGHEHIMIMDNNDELAAGDTVTFTVTDSEDKTYELKDVPVRVQQSTHEHYGDAQSSESGAPMSEMNMDGHEGHDHEGHDH